MLEKMHVRPPFLRKASGKCRYLGSFMQAATALPTARYLSTFDRLDSLDLLNLAAPSIQES